MSPAGNRRRRGSSPTALRGLLVLGFVLAIAATVLVVFTEQVQWLRFAVLLALWAALIAAFAVARSRRDARTADMRAEDSKRTYELELHREISARREYEIGVAEGAREDAEARHREELAALREQLDRLNTTLSGLLEGDLLFERLTLSAESTRVRQVGDGRNRPGNAGRPGQIAGGTEMVQHARPMSGPRGDNGQARGLDYPVRDDDTVQFPRATIGSGAQPAPVTPGVVDAASPSVDQLPLGEPTPAADPQSVQTQQPEPMPQPEPAAEPEPEPMPQPEPAAEPEPEPAAEPEPEREPEPEPEPAAEPEPEPQPTTEPEPAAERELSGAGHSAGVSVADLLAAYGSSDSAPRRRRRAAED